MFDSRWGLSMNLRKTQDKVCLCCGSPISRKRYHDYGVAKFCSVHCQMEHQYAEYVIEWKAGRASGMRGKHNALSRHVHRYIHEKYSDRCARCTWHKKNPVTGRSPLEIEHIDGNHTNCSEENLILLCPNCHSLTPTYKNLNYGHGRAARRSQ